MIFGGEEKSVHAPMDYVRVRPLGLERILTLGPNELIYVQDCDFESRVLTPAYRKQDSDYYLKSGETPRLHVRSIYGSEFFVAAETDVFEADDEGEEMPVIRTAGSRLSSSLFFTGLDEAEAVERLKKALRTEFGPGIVEVWNLRSSPVRDLRYDIYETRTAWVPKEGSRKGRGQEGSFEVVEKRLLARGVRDGHQHHFVGTQSKGWSLLVEVHQSDTAETEVL